MTQALTTSLPEHLRARQVAVRRERGVQIAAMLVALGCLAGAGMFLRPMNDIRKERQLVIDPESIEGLPPTIALIGKLGTFRALAIDWASIRAERLKQEGKHYEALHLHEMICKLAPRFPKVWATAAWNMSYNISVGQYTPEARWKWVHNGIKLLRDDGLRYNPRSITLYKELAWIFWHKIGDILDDEHLNYKRALAVEMERVLGAPPVTLNDEQYFEWFGKIVDAPRDLDRLVETDEEIARIVSLLGEVHLKPDDGLLDFVARNIRPGLTAAELRAEQTPEEDALHVQRLALLRDPQHAAAVDRLLAAVRSEVLRERYKMDLDWMRKLMVEDYGPLDWRNAFAHALYWSSWGDKQAQGIVGGDRADRMNTARFIFFSLQSVITRGRIVLWPNFDDPFISYIDLTPDVRFIPYLFETYLRIGKQYYGDDPKFVEGTPGPNYMTGFVSNMENWIQLLYLEGGEGNLEQAENYYAWLRQYNKHPDGSTQARYTKTIDEFVMGDLLGQLDTHRAANGLIRGFIVRGLKHLGLGQEQAGTTSLERARLSYEYWMRDSDADINDRRKMQPFPVLVRDQTVEFVKQAEISALFKARLWRALPLEMRQMTWDSLLPYFEELAAAQDPPWSRELAFDTPPGMEEFRKRPIETIGAPRRENVETGEKHKQ